MASITSSINDLYLETKKLFVGSICEVLAGSYHTISLPEPVRFYPRADDNGFVLHKGRINGYGEIGNKIVALRHHYDNIFCPRHYNNVGVRTWMSGDAACTQSFYNYVLKLKESGLLRDEPNASNCDNFLEYVNPGCSLEDIREHLEDLLIRGGSGSADSQLVLKSCDTVGYPFLETYATSLLMTTNHQVFKDLDGFSIKDTERILYIFNQVGKLVAVLCKIFHEPESVGFPLGDEALYMVSKDQDVIFVDFLNSYYEACGADLTDDDYLRPY